MPVIDVSFGTIWEGVADALPEAVAVRSPDVTLTYAQLDQRAARLAASMQEHGAGPTSTVASYLHNCPQYLETVFAAFKLGAAPVNANYRYRGAELTELLVGADAEVLVYSASLADAVRQAAAHVPSLRLLVQVGPAVLPAVRGAAAVVLPRRLLLVGALPRTPTGKLEVSRVRELLHEGEVSG